MKKKEKRWFVISYVFFFINTFSSPIIIFYFIPLCIIISFYVFITFARPSYSSYFFFPLSQFASSPQNEPPNPLSTYRSLIPIELFYSILLIRLNIIIFWIYSFFDYHPSFLQAPFVLLFNFFFIILFFSVFHLGIFLTIKDTVSDYYSRFTIFAFTAYCTLLIVRYITNEGDEL